MVKTMTQGGTSLNTQAVAGKTEKSAPRFRFRALSLGKLAGRALDAVLPPQCPACGEVVEDAGWVVLELEGSEEALSSGIDWITSKGVRVDPVGGSIVEG